MGWVLLLSMQCPQTGRTRAFPEAVWLETECGCHACVSLCVHVCVSVYLGEKTRPDGIGHGCLSGDPEVRVPLCLLRLVRIWVLARLRRVGVGVQAGARG